MTASTPSPNIVLQRSLLWDLVAAAVIAAIGVIVGAASVGWIGVWSAILGGAIAAAFVGLTAASILFAGRFTASPSYVVIFFGLILGGWFVKMALFIAVALILEGRSWLNPTVLFGTVIVSVIASLIVDILVFAKSRVSYIS